MRRWLSAKSWRQGNGRRKSLDASAEKLGGRLLAKRHKAVLKLGRNFKKLSPQERHQLRIVLKKLRYTAEFFRSLYQKKHEKASRARSTAEQPGHMNDIVVADHPLERLSAAREGQRASDHLHTAVGLVAGWHTHSAISSEHEAEANWHEFCRCDSFW
jgi:triphosphatase